MTSPRTASKVLLLASPRGSAAGSASSPLRRFRIARLPLDRKLAVGDARFAPVKGS